MTYEMMMNLYNLLSASHHYIVGFVFKGILYYVVLDFNGMSRYIKLDRASSARGGFAKLRLRINSAEKADLAKVATMCGMAEDLTKMDKYNKGENFERIITELLTDTKWSKDSVPFNVAGDVVINGENFQIKLDCAEITNERILKKLTEK